MTKSRIKRPSGINPFIIMVDSMYDKRVFCLVTLRRKLFPYFKTSHRGNLVTLTCKHTGHKIAFKLTEFEGRPMCSVYWSTVYQYKVVFDFFVYSNKNFLEKLIAQGLITSEQFNLNIYSHVFKRTF